MFRVQGSSPRQGLVYGGNSGGGREGQASSGARGHLTIELFVIAARRGVSARMLFVTTKARNRKRRGVNRKP